MSKDVAKFFNVSYQKECHHLDNIVQSSIEAQSKRDE